MLFLILLNWRNWSSWRSTCTYLSIKNYLLKNHKQISYGCEYMETLKLFIWAERTGIWNLHLIAAGKMLNLFATTGHIHYAKSSRLYLQLMRELPIDHPWLYHCFTEQGFHTARRSSRYWAGLGHHSWCDHAIKSCGGLMRGREVTETVRLQWIYSMHNVLGSMMLWQQPQT